MEGVWPSWHWSLSLSKSAQPPPQVLQPDSLVRDKHAPCGIHTLLFLLPHPCSPWSPPNPCGVCYHWLRTVCLDKPWWIHLAWVWQPLPHAASLCFWLQLRQRAGASWLPFWYVCSLQIGHRRHLEESEMRKVPAWRKTYILYVPIINLKYTEICVQAI